MANIKKISLTIIGLLILGVLCTLFFIYKKDTRVNLGSGVTCLAGQGSDTNVYSEEIASFITNYSGTTNVCFSGLEKGWCIMYYNGPSNTKVIQEVFSGFGYKSTDGYVYEKLTCDCKMGISTHEILKGDNIDYYVLTDDKRVKNTYNALSSGLFVSFPTPTMCQ